MVRTLLSGYAVVCLKRLLNSILWKLRIRVFQSQFICNQKFTFFAVKASLYLTVPGRENISEQGRFTCKHHKHHTHCPQLSLPGPFSLYHLFFPFLLNVVFWIQVYKVFIITGKFTLCSKVRFHARKRTGLALPKFRDAGVQVVQRWSDTEIPVHQCVATYLPGGTGAQCDRGYRVHG